MKQLVFNIEGMGCQACALRIENAVRKLDGVLAADVSLERKTLTLRAEDNVSAETVIAAVDDAGFDAAPAS